MARSTVCAAECCGSARENVYSVDAGRAVLGAAVRSAVQLADGGFQRPPRLPSREGRAHGLRPCCPTERHFRYEAPGAAPTVRAGGGRFTSWGEKGPQSPRGALGQWPPGRELTRFPARSDRRARGSPQNRHPGASRVMWQEEHVGWPEGSRAGGEKGGTQETPQVPKHWAPPPLCKECFNLC